MQKKQIKTILLTHWLKVFPWVAHTSTSGDRYCLLAQMHRPTYGDRPTLLHDYTHTDAPKIVYFENLGVKNFNNVFMFHFYLKFVILAHFFIRNIF